MVNDEQRPVTIAIVGGGQRGSVSAKKILMVFTSIQILTLGCIIDLCQMVLTKPFIGQNHSHLRTSIIPYEQDW